MTRLVLALALLASPIAAFAQCGGGHVDQASSCAQGYTWDTEKGACVPVVTG